ncbi:MAG TPA: DNA gyrase inhibitor YacG [Stellaceae bacterium]|nr:DNA gyrase inhibitor YacG [Stellaceae bacterium]
MPEDTAAVRRCPICGKPTIVRHRPFCSRRCAIIDLGRWLKEDYHIPAAGDPEEPSEDDGES